MSLYEIPPVKEKKPEPKDFGLTHEQIQNMYVQNKRREKNFWFTSKICYIIFSLFLGFYLDAQPKEYFIIFLMSFVIYLIPFIILYQVIFSSKLSIVNNRIRCSCDCTKNDEYRALLNYNFAVDSYYERRKFVNTLKKMTKESFWINEKNEYKLNENLYDLFLSCNYHITKYTPYYDSFILKKDKKEICLIYGDFLKFSQRYAARARIYKDNVEIWLLSINGYDDKLLKVAKKYNMKLLEVSDLVKMAKMYLRYN